VLGTIITSFDVYAAQVPCIQIFGTEGTLNVPDPNGFGGPVKYWRPDTDGWVEVPVERPYAENSRCIGVADMANAIRGDRPHRANGRMAYHVLDVMHGFLDASDQGRHIAVESTCDRPAPLPEGLAEGELD
jgi:predicted dehydrogenase